jgi:hypothetical protein
LRKASTVLIADVVASTARKGLREALGKRLDASSKVHLKKGWIKLPYAITAGDEFQAILGKESSAAEVMFDLRVRFWPLRLRIGIGVGRVGDKIKKPVNRMSGEAFQRARRAIESIKDEQAKYELRTAFRTGHEGFDSTANLIYALQDTLFMGITRKQWDTIRAYYAEGGVVEAAKRLRLNKSTISRNLKRSSYWQMRDTVTGMERLIRAEKW